MSTSRASVSPHARPTRRLPATEASRVRRRTRRSPLVVARTGQSHGRGRSRHASSLGGRGPDRGVRDARAGIGASIGRPSRRSSPPVEPAAGRWPAWAPARNASPAPIAGATPATRPRATSRPTTIDERELLPARRPAPRRGARRPPRRRCRRRGRTRALRSRGDGARRRPRPPAGDLRDEPDRGGRAVRGGPPAVPRRADRAGPAAGARCGPAGGPLPGRVGAARPAAAPAHRDLPGRGRGHEPRGRPAGPDLDPRARLRGRAVRPVARAARRVPADLDARDALLRRRRRLRGAGRGERLERGAVPDLVPDRRGLDGRLAGARDGVPAGQDAVRLQLRAVPLPGRAVHLPGPQQARVRGRRDAAAAVLHRGRTAGAGRRGRDVLRQRPVADPGRRPRSSARRCSASC